MAGTSSKTKVLSIRLRMDAFAALEADALQQGITPQALALLRLEPPSSTAKSTALAIRVPKEAYDRLTALAQKEDVTIVSLVMRGIWRVLRPDDMQRVADKITDMVTRPAVKRVKKIIADRALPTKPVGIIASSQSFASLPVLTGQGTERRPSPKTKGKP